MKKRVLAIALDGATFDILDPWLTEGHLPTLKKLIDGGGRAQLMTIFPPITPAAWSSFATGKNPAKHGIFEFLQRRDGGYDSVPMNASKRHGRSLWHILSTLGKESVVVNVPMTYPPEPVKGALVCGFPVPSQRQDFTYPDDLVNDIQTWIPDYSINYTKTYVRGKAEDFLNEARTKMDFRMQLMEKLLGEKIPGWDFAMMHILGTDRIQHEFWHCMDTTHPRHKGEALQYQHAIRDFYKHIDANLNRVLQFADEETTVIILSDHGFGPLYQFVYVNIWLLQQGYLVLKRDALTRLKHLAFKLGFSPVNIYNLLSLFGMQGVSTEVGMDTRQKLLDTVFLSFQDVDWSRTRAYARGNFGQIYVNLKGREPEGIVEPGEDYDRLVDDIRQNIEKTMIAPETGQKLAKSTHRRDEWFNGHLLDRAPDVVVLMDDERYVPLGTADFAANAIASPAIGNTGDHRFNGILIMNGRGIKPGIDLKKASLMDIAPTILHLLDEAVPSDMDGKVLLNALKSDLQEVRYQEVSESDVSTFSGGKLTAEEESEIAKHLQDLGYLG